MSELEIEFQITPDDGDPYTLIADSRDLYVWEKTTPNKQVTFMQVMEEVRFLELYRIAWIAARRQGMYTSTIDDFAGSHQVEPHGEVEDEDDESPVPTPPAASTAAASRSPSPPESPRRSGQKKATGR